MGWSVRKRGKRQGGVYACPFCREIYVEEDGVDRCPDCDIALRDFVSLPPSEEAIWLAGEEKKVLPSASTETLAWHDFGRGRGVLLACGVLGLVAFYLPWSLWFLPDRQLWSAAVMARSQPFFWLVLTSWFVSIPAVLSRRTPVSMARARTAMLMLSILPLLWCGFLWQLPTVVVRRFVHFEYQWTYGFYITAGASLVATIQSVFFGLPLERGKNATRNA
jgi:hypothetical protein